MVTITGAVLKSFTSYVAERPYATGVATLIGIDGAGDAAKADSWTLTPEMFGAVGDGTTVDNTALTAWVTACNAAGIPASGTPGASYRCSSTLALTLRVPFSGNGCEFVVPNDGQTNAVLTFAAVASDIESVSLATVNTWTGMEKGSNLIPELDEKDWQYSFTTTDEFIMVRASSNSLYKGETIVVGDDLGYLDVPLVHTYTLPLTQVTCTRTRIRDALEVNGFRVRVIDGTGAGSGYNKVVQITRPKTRVTGVTVFNEGTQNVQQAFATNNAADVVYENCYAVGMTEISTEYGFNANYCSRITYINCYASECRRAIDSHACKFVRIEGGTFPNGVGAHWVDFFDVVRANLGHRNTANYHCVKVAGSNIRVTDCNATLNNPGTDVLQSPQALWMRSDLPEISGYCIWRGGTITIYDVDDAIPGTQTIDLMKLNKYDPCDYERDIYLPDYLEFTPDLIIQKGADSDNFINLVSYGEVNTAANVPNNVVAGGRIVIRPGKIVLEAGELLGSSARVKVLLSRGETQIGEDTDVLIQNVSNLLVFCSPTTATVPDDTGRFNIVVEDAGASSQYVLRYGACKTARLRRCAQVPTAMFTRTGSVSAFKDEAIDYEDFGAGHQGLGINPFGAIIQRGNALTLADGAYGPDGWIVLSSGGNVETSTGADINDDLPFVMQYKQLDATARKIGAVSFIPASASKPLRSRLTTLLARVLLTVDGTLNYAVIEWTGTADSPTRDVVNDWNDPVLAAGDFFAASYVVAASGSIALTANTYTIIEPLYAHIGSTCNNIAIVFWTNAAIAQDAYFRVATDLFPGFERPFFQRRNTSEERLRCLPWYRTISMVVSTVNKYVSLSPPMVKAPTVTPTVGTKSNETIDGFDIVHSGSASTVIAIAGDI